MFNLQSISLKTEGKNLMHASFKVTVAERGS